uniref:Uncharacterized protein n=1 Tax=Gasterosteus aculeatus aculeatus TaxID=481459 RepID=A0AAQ4NSH6_GASAC
MTERESSVRIPRARSCTDSDVAALYLTHLDIQSHWTHHELPGGGDVHGDRRLRVLSVRLGPGVLHPPHRVLDLLRGGHHRADHRQLLLQPVEGLRLGHHGGVGLQGLPVHAGPACVPTRLSSARHLRRHHRFLRRRPHTRRDEMHQNRRIGDRQRQGDLRGRGDLPGFGFELGAAVFVGWGGSVLLLSGGTVLTYFSAKEGLPKIDSSAARPQRPATYATARTGRTYRRPDTSSRAARGPPLFYEGGRSREAVKTRLTFNRDSFV